MVHVNIGIVCVFFFFFKQKTAYEITRRDWSSDVCSSDLPMPSNRSGAKPSSIVIPRRFSSGSRSVRSEERRVGKECALLCRSWWSPCHKKQNPISSASIRRFRTPGSSAFPTSDSSCRKRQSTYLFFQAEDGIRANKA